MHYFYGISYQGRIILYTLKWGFPDSSVGKESACNPGETGLIPGSGKRPWRRDRLPPPVFLGFPRGSAGKESACNVGDLGLIPSNEYERWLSTLFCHNHFSFLSSSSWLLLLKTIYFLSPHYLLIQSLWYGWKELGIEGWGGQIKVYKSYKFSVLR